MSKRRRLLDYHEVHNPLSCVSCSTRRDLLSKSSLWQRFVGIPDASDVILSVLRACKDNGLIRNLYEWSKFRPYLIGTKNQPVDDFVDTATELMNLLGYEDVHASRVVEFARGKLQGDGGTDVFFPKRGPIPSFILERLADRLQGKCDRLNVPEWYHALMACKSIIMSESEQTRIWREEICATRWRAVDYANRHELVLRFKEGPFQPQCIYFLHSNAFGKVKKNMSVAGQLYDADADVWINQILMLATILNENKDNPLRCWKTLLEIGILGCTLDFCKSRNVPRDVYVLISAYFLTSDCITV